MNEQDDDDVVVIKKNDIKKLSPFKFKERQKLKQLQTHIPISHDLYQRFSDEYIKIKYNNDENKIKENIEKEIDDTFFDGFLNKKKFLTTSSTSLLFEEKPPRRDVLENLGKIANEFLLLPTYPEIHPSDLKRIINKVMGSRVKRTKDKYKRCILQYANSQNRLGILDVSRFVERIPKNYLKS